MVDAKQRVEIDENVVFASVAGRELRADVYRPPTISPARPGILLIYGGAWRTGEPAMMRGYAIKMAQQGYPCVVGEYRLTGEATWPAQIEDVHAAIGWMCEHGSEFGLDPNRIVLWGQSSGGHLALLAAAEISDLDGTSSPIAATVTYYPVTSLEPSLGTAWEAVHALRPGASDEELRGMSPLVRVGPSMPPTLLLHGAADEMVVPDQSLRLYEALTAVGVPVELHMYAGLPHGFDLDRGLARHSLDVASLFLSRYAPLPDAHGDS